MAELTPSHALLSTLSGKHVLLTGGSNGIGASTVRLFASLGARVTFCDLDSARGRALAHELGPHSARFEQVDVTDYAAQHGMFARAVEHWGPPDVVVCNAGLPERGDIFSPSADLNKPPDLTVLDANLRAALYTARLALGFMRPPAGAGGALVLVSSVAGILESPGLWVYGPSKHGVVGMMRGLRSVALTEWGVAVNCICPWMTKTGMVHGIEDAWAAAGLPSNDPSDVALAIALTATANNVPLLPGAPGQQGHPGAPQPFNGKAVYVAGGRFFEVEGNIDRLAADWLGAKNLEEFLRGQEVLGAGDGWTSKQ